ncbi:MAG: DUF4384 domain-containing protein [Blastocatellia bacterium]
MIKSMFSSGASTTVTVLFLALIFTLFSVPVLGQGDESSAKNLYLVHSQNARRGKPGAKITILLQRNGRTSQVPLSYAFTSGDKIKFQFQTNFDSYVRILNLGTNGELQTLYPYNNQTSERLTRLSNYEIPQKGWLEFDKNPGTEQLAFIFSKQPIVVQPASDDASVSAGSIYASPSAGTHSSNTDQATALQALNSRALKTGLDNAKNLTLVPDSHGGEVCNYGFIASEHFRGAVTIKINLKHL